MKRTNTVTLKEAIDEMLKAYGLDVKMAEKKLIASWAAAVGEPIARHTTKLRITNRKLIVKLDSAVIREELTYAKSKLLELLEKEAGAKVVDDIVFC